MAKIWPWVLPVFLAASAVAQTYAPPQPADFQAALDRANVATTNPAIGANLPGYKGEAAGLQSRAGSGIADLQADGAAAATVDPMSPVIGQVNRYNAANPVSENAAWVKGALGVANNPTPSAGGTLGATQSVCRSSQRQTGQQTLYSCEVGNVIESDTSQCSIYRDIVSVPATRTCASDSYFDAFSTYPNIGSYTEAHRCTLYAGSSGLNLARGCGLLIVRISAGDCAPPRQIAGNLYLEYCRSAVTTGIDVTYLGSRSWECAAESANPQCTRTGATCTKWLNQANGICETESVTFNCGGAGWEDRGTNALACQSLSGNPACSETGRSCLQRAGEVPDIMAALGLPADTCLKASVDYSCDRLVGAGSDCEVPAGCTLKSRTCIDPDYDATSACRTYDQVYACQAVTPSQDAGAYCDASWVNGTAIITASDDPENDLPEALSAINALKDASASYRDSGALTVFGGKSLRCGKSIGGLSNCCKDSGLLLDISLTRCNSEEKELGAQQKKKACHYVGTYCSNKSLFGCLMKKMTYCCYGSVLARIVEEAGHKQLGKSWGDAKHPSCGGFTVAEFQMIDLTNVDFSDFYADRMASLATHDPTSTVAAIAASIETMNSRREPKP